MLAKLKNWGKRAWTGFTRSVVPIGFGVGRTVASMGQVELTLPKFFVFLSRFSDSLTKEATAAYLLPATIVLMAANAIVNGATRVPNLWNRARRDKRADYDVVLLSLNPDFEIDSNALQKISEKHKNKPIIIKYGDMILMYGLKKPWQITFFPPGFTKNIWGLSELDFDKFKSLPFPKKIDDACVLSFHALDKDMFEDILSKKAHIHVKNDQFDLLPASVEKISNVLCFGSVTFASVSSYLNSMLWLIFIARLCGEDDSDNHLIKNYGLQFLAMFFAISNFVSSYSMNYADAQVKSNNLADQIQNRKFRKYGRILIRQKNDILPEDLVSTLVLDIPPGEGDISLYGFRLKESRMKRYGDVDKEEFFKRFRRDEIDPDRAMPYTIDRIDDEDDLIDKISLLCNAAPIKFDRYAAATLAISFTGTVTQPALAYLATFNAPDKFPFFTTPVEIKTILGSISVATVTASNLMNNIPSIDGALRTRQHIAHKVNSKKKRGWEPLAEAAVGTIGVVDSFMGTPMSFFVGLSYTLESWFGWDPTSVAVIIPNVICSFSAGALNYFFSVHYSFKRTLEQSRPKGTPPSSTDDLIERGEASIARPVTDSHVTITHPTSSAAIREGLAESSNGISISKSTDAMVVDAPVTNGIHHSESGDREPLLPKKKNGYIDQPADAATSSNGTKSKRIRRTSLQANSHFSFPLHKDSRRRSTISSVPVYDPVPDFAPTW